MFVGETVGIAETDGINFGVLAQKAVVKASTVAETIAFAVKTEARNQGDGVCEIGNFRGVAWFGDVESACLERGFGVEQVKTQSFESFWVVRGGIFEVDARESEAFLARILSEKGSNIDLALNGKIQ